jgi:hypothetical protein
MRLALASRLAGSFPWAHWRTSGWVVWGATRKEERAGERRGRRATRKEERASGRRGLARDPQGGVRRRAASFSARPARKSAPGCGCGHPHDSRTPTPTTKTYRWGPRASHPNDEDLSLGTPDWSPALRFVLVTNGRAGNRVRLPQTLRLPTAKTFIFSKGHSGATLRSQLSFGVLLERRRPGRQIIWPCKRDHDGNCFPGEQGKNKKID